MPAATKKVTNDGTIRLLIGLCRAGSTLGTTTTSETHLMTTIEATWTVIASTAPTQDLDERCAVASMANLATDALAEARA